MYSFIYCLFFNCFRYSLAYIKFDSISFPKVITESLSSSFSLDSDLYLSIEKDPNTYEHVDLETVLDVYKHFILEWNLMSRYIDQHEDRFIAQAVRDSAFISHPVPFTAQDFQSIFDEILS